MKLIVGLGNPGREYKNTRHNIGFMVIDKYLERVNWKEKYESYLHIKEINGEQIAFIKPLTYMNLSGKTVKKFVDYYKINIEDIFVIQDDIDLMLGKYRIKKDSSSGGHNGIKSIITELKSDSFARLKIGIGKENIANPEKFVISKMFPEELAGINKNMDTFCEIITSFINDGVDKTIQNYNKK